MKPIHDLRYLTERDMVKLVARLSPWLAPIPSAFFVSRSAMAHLTLPWFMAVIVAVIIETLGLATVHTALWLADWNTIRRKNDPIAPVTITLVLGGVYLLATVGLTVVLEVHPTLATFAPALFPALAVVGAINLALISQQEQREAAVAAERELRRADRSARRSGERPDSRSDDHSGERSTNVQLDDYDNGPARAPERAGSHALGALNDANAARRANKQSAMNALLAYVAEHPNASLAEIGRAIGRGKSTVSSYLDELEQGSRIRRNGDGIEVLND